MQRYPPSLASSMKATLQSVLEKDAEIPITTQRLKDKMTHLDEKLSCP